MEIAVINEDIVYHSSLNIFGWIKAEQIKDKLIRNQVIRRFLWKLYYVRYWISYKLITFYLILIYAWFGISKIITLKQRISNWCFICDQPSSGLSYSPELKTLYIRKLNSLGIQKRSVIWKRNGISIWCRIFKK